MTDDRIERLLMDLVLIDSANPDLVPGGVGESAIAVYLHAWATERGISAEIVEAAPGRPNVIMRATGSGGGKTLLLNAHTDTVGGDGLVSPAAAPFIENGRLHGRGALDTKGGLAALMVALEDIALLNLRGSVVLTAVCDEEYGSLGTEALIGDVVADAAIVSEPTSLSIVTTHRGFAWIEVTVNGFAAHGSRWQLGIDAIAKAGGVLTGIDDLARTLIQGVQHPLLGPGSVHASVISGGNELSSYPKQCVIGLERRTLPGETPADALAEIEEILARLRAQDPAFDACARVVFSREPLEVEPSSEIVQVLSRAVVQVLGQEAAISGGPGWMDSALLSAAGIPTVVLGPSGEGLHGDDEWVTLESVAQVHACVVAAAGEFCA